MLRVVQVVRQQPCNGHCLSDSVQHSSERAIAQCTSRWAMARGHRLNTSIVLAAVHGLSGLFRAVSAVEPITLAPFPLCPPSLIGHPASVDVKQHKSQKKRQRLSSTSERPSTAKTTQHPDPSIDPQVDPSHPSPSPLILPFVPATSCPDPNIDPQVDQAYFAPHSPRLPMVLTMIYPKQAYFIDCP